jgi:hypothetical protein
VKKRLKFPTPRRSPVNTATLTVTPQMLNAIVAALQAMPYKDAAPVLAEIDRQMKEQMARASVPTIVPPPPAE